MWAAWAFMSRGEMGLQKIASARKGGSCFRSILHSRTQPAFRRKEEEKAKPEEQIPLVHDEGILGLFFPLSIANGRAFFATG